MPDRRAKTFTEFLNAPVALEADHQTYWFFFFFEAAPVGSAQPGLTHKGMFAARYEERALTVDEITEQAHARRALDGEWTHVIVVQMNIGGTGIPSAEDSAQIRNSFLRELEKVGPDAADKFPVFDRKGVRLETL